ncbi:DUF1194 domain-containing protein [uncultured Aureimonas sp.]|uniref:DUF1194 domain-containing protein n=1 Tax=uncultured Aureimonas sp. TaxID=1604662 RepID=UPI0025D9C692|nr:DUF1194 domain-containing protein [uncultured Aureimonas sp.]
MLKLVALAICGSLLSSIPAVAAGDEPVDVELVIAVDVSWSMDYGELDIQRNGYVAAFRSPELQQAITDGMHGRVAVTYVEWAGDTSQQVVLPWTLIDGKDSAEAFAYRLAEARPDRMRRTSISSAIDFAAGLFDRNGFEGMRRVIDVSGDGPNNQGRPVTDARDAAVARGITINGLPLMTQGDDLRGGWGSIQNLDRYYSDCVIGGPGAFVIPVNDWEQFPQAVRRKLVLELAGLWPVRLKPGVVVPVAADGPPTNCLIGEAQWQERWQR